MNSRQFRLNCITTKVDPESPGPVVKGRIYQGPSGVFRHITANEDGSITISAKAFVDDVVAFLSQAISTNPTISNEIKNHLRHFVNDMDKRAMAKHGYSHSEEEKAVDWFVNMDAPQN